MVVVALGLGGCFLLPTLVEPADLANAAPRREVWAVAPFANESGVTSVDAFRFADQFTNELEGVSGIDTLPVNRVIFVMRDLGMTAVTSPHDARLLLHALGADALVVGTVTAWDPYPPPSLGAAVQLYQGTSDHSGSTDLQTLVRSPSGAATPTERGPTDPVAQASGYFDAENHRTLMWLAEYSRGRSFPDSAYGPDVYLKSMELYTQFVSYRLIHDLLEDHRIRQMPVATAEPPR